MGIFVLSCKFFGLGKNNDIFWTCWFVQQQIIKLNRQDSLIPHNCVWVCFFFFLLLMLRANPNAEITIAAAIISPCNFSF